MMHPDTAIIALIVIAAVSGVVVNVDNALRAYRAGRRIKANQKGGRKW